MIYDADDTLFFPPELGARLRGLRKARGLTQTELARLMGRQGRGAASLVSRLETGRQKEPTLRLIADYLRACGVGFAGIIDILDRYTARPTVVERRGAKAVQAVARELPVERASEVVRYDTKVALARRASGRKPETADKRSLRARNLAAARIRQERARVVVLDALNHCGVHPKPNVQFILIEYGRRAWGILNRKRKSEPELKQKRLEELDTWVVSSGIVPAGAVRYVRGELERLLRDLEQPDRD